MRTIRGKFIFQIDCLEMLEPPSIYFFRGAQLDSAQCVFHFHNNMKVNFTVFLNKLIVKKTRESFFKKLLFHKQKVHALGYRKVKVIFLFFDNILIFFIY